MGRMSDLEISSSQRLKKPPKVSPHEKLSFQGLLPSNKLEELMSMEKNNWI